MQPKKPCDSGRGQAPPGIGTTSRGRSSEIPQSRDGEARTLKERLRAFWDAQQCYWDITSSGKCVESPARQRAASFLREGESVLDVACGTAANAAWLKERCRYFGVDLSVTALQQPIHTSLRLACGDADHLPFRQDAFDESMFPLLHSTNHLIRPDDVHGIRVVDELRMKCVRLINAHEREAPEHPAPYLPPEAAIGVAR